jgi:dipeptidyl-peptidase-4
VVRWRLGEQELADQLFGVRFLKRQAWVDTTRIGIWGWSYGGFMTATALLRAPRVFRAGAAVAPVTDWRLYDSIYTERYMGLPDENREGYEKTSLIGLADSLRAAFLLVHGTVDDNVHMQNSLRLAKALQRAGKPFEMMVYPGKEHGIRGREVRIHLFETLTRFFETHLGGGTRPRKN